MNRGKQQKKTATCSRCDQRGQPGSTGELNETVKDFLDQTHYSSLCETCLSDLEKLVIQARESPWNARGQLEENVHYYIENGLMVFTELYHISRGYCCKSGCRHCAYGYKPDI